jgi:hypothetical protein
MKIKFLILVIFFYGLLPVRLFAQAQKGNDYEVIDHANIAVFLIDFPDTKDSIRDLYPSAEEIRMELFDSTRMTQQYLKAMSYGKFKLAGDVFGPFRHQDPITADNDYQKDAYLTINSIKIPEFQYSKYTHFAFISFNDYIGWGGCAFAKSYVTVSINDEKYIIPDYFRMVIQVGYNERNKANFFINTFVEPYPFIIDVPRAQHPDGEFYFQNYTGMTYFNRGFLHEFIHTLHVWNHANSKTNSNHYSFEPEVSNNQNFLNKEYGNGFDMMGSAFYSFSLNGGVRDLLGWTDNNNRIKLDTYSKQRICLYPINRKEGYRICEIRLPNKYYTRDITKDVFNFPENGRKNMGYFLEVRETDIWDSTLSHPSINANASGIMLLETDGWSTFLLDASPSLNLGYDYFPDWEIHPDLRNDVLEPGMIYKNSNVCFSNVEKHNDGSFSVDVEIYDPSNPERLIPVARTGKDQLVNEGTVVSLDGSSSSDPDGNQLTYKWTVPTGITLNSTTVAQPTFTAPEVQKDSIFKFSLVVNDGNVDSNPASVNITVLNIIKVGVSAFDSPKFKVYPNPTTGIITLEFTQNNGKKAEVSVTNLIGAVVFRKELTYSANYQVDLSNQASGIYLLKVSLGNQDQVYNTKIVVRK